MKNKIKFVIIFSFFIILISCKTNMNKVNSNIEFTGIYESFKGVMQPISCFCYETGYLTLENGEKIPICFDNLNTDKIVSNSKISVKGKYEILKHAFKENDPCTEGEMKIFIVSEFKVE